MEDKMTDRILKKLDDMDDKINNIDKTLVRNTASLDEHIRRTELLEEAIKPVQEHVSMMKGAAKLIGYISLIVGIAVALAKIVS